MCKLFAGAFAALKFFRKRRPNMRYQPFLARSKTAIIFSPLCQAHVVWGNDAHRIGILVILSVVLPEAHRANVVPTSFFECFVVAARSEEHTSELQSHSDLVCRLLL